MSADNWTKCPKCSRDNFSENYDIGVVGNIFSVDYTGNCPERHGGCGFKYKFEIKKEVING